ncbi:MAG: helix-turn-helix domain-containing protein [Firmicutes bacterium]|nr:helix-turn-helix domain-containing protein [Bacillota bacterium]
MDYNKIGAAISRCRKEKGLTQKQLAQLLQVSDKTVSKWERGCGCPEVSLLPGLAQTLGLELEALLQGEIEARSHVGGNLQKGLYYVCPECGNLIFAAGSAAISCCGRKLEALEPVKAIDHQRLLVEEVEDEWLVTTGHPMTKEHYLSFIAFVRGDRLQLVKLYPEWDVQVRFPRRGHGRLIWYCNKHGLFYQLL